MAKSPTWSSSTATSPRAVRIKVPVAKQAGPASKITGTPFSVPTVKFGVVPGPRVAATL
jgi:hypothetical protein